MKGAQLALPVQLSQVPAFDNFFAGPNAAVVELLRQLGRGGAVSAVWLYGAPASGKSHLLQATASALGGQYLRLGADGEFPDAVESDQALLALDDVDAALRDEATALRLLRLIDLRRTRNLPMLLAAGAPPARLDIALADLRTRLEAMVILGLKPLSESDRRELLRLHADLRGLELADDAGHWLLAHLRRDAGSLIAALDRIDRAALSAQRRPTLPFVLQVLAPTLQPSLALESGQTSSD